MRIALSLFAAALLPALFAPAFAPAFAAPPKPCDLLTPHQAQTLIGGKTSPGRDKSTGSVSGCYFSNPDDSKSVYISFLTTSTFDANDQARIIPFLKNSEGGPTIPNLGDFAIAPVRPDRQSIVVLYRGYLIGLDLKGANPVPGNKNAMVALMRHAIAKF